MINYYYGDVILSTLRDKDMSIINAWRNEPAIRNWCRQTGLIPMGNQLMWFDRINSDNSVKMYGIYASKGLVGVTGLTDITPTHNSAEFSIYIAPDFQKKGYGEGALKSLIRHGFEELNLNRIFGETFDGNPGIKLYEKLGFTKEGTLRQTYYKCGKYIDSHVYSLLRGEVEWIKI